MPSDELLTDDELLELSSFQPLDLVRDLVVRGRHLTSFEPYACKLPSLEALSLSHNRICSLSGFCNLPLLTNVNLSNNCLSNLDGLQKCQLLQCLYVSNNLIRDISPLAKLKGLRVLHLVKNSLSALTSVVTVISQLDNLIDLDLSGNPVSSIPEYKRTLLAGVAERACTEGYRISLTSLDGDSLSPMDLEIAVNHSRVGGNESSSVLQIPGKEDNFQKSSADDQALPELSIRGPGSMQMVRPSTSAQMRPGTSGSSFSSNAHVRLVADELLNDHPVLLEYLATHVLKEGMEALGSSAAKADGSTLVASSSSTVSKIRSSFVNRLRGTAAASSATEGKSVSDLVACGQDGLMVSAQASHKKEASKAQLAAAESLVMGASPQETIRQLVRLCEVLIREVQEQRAANQGQRVESGKASVKSDKVSQLEAEVEKMKREMMQLKQENANVTWLAEEYRQMKAEQLARK
jgi:hypothetical protein